MPKTKISEFSATAGNNTDIDGINIAEGCPPSGINDAIRELMAQLKDFQAGTAGDSFNGPVGTTTPAAGAFTNFSASGTFALTGDQVQISEGGTGQTTANAAFNALAPSQSTHAGKYLKTDGTNTSWDAIEINTADITGTLPVANGGTGVTSSTGTGSVVLSASPTFTGTVNGAALTLSSSLTLSGGTANGVAYLNGSKVLTTGSALVFDGSNLGIGVTPAAWSGVRGLDVGSGANIAVASNSGGAYLTLNSYYNGASWIYKTTAAASYYAQVGGEHLWYNAGSGTAGNAITFTQAMTLGTTGNLGIGTSSPSYRLDVQTTATGTAAGDNTAIYLASQASGRDVNIRMGDGVNASARLGYLSGNMYFYTNAAERMRLDTSGNLGIGTSSPAYPLHVVTSSTSVAAFRNSGAAISQALVGNTAGDLALRTLASGDALIFSDASKYLAFGSNGATERMRITSAGDVGIGTSSPASKLAVVGAARLTADGSSVSLYTGEGWRHTGSSGLYIDANSGGAANSVFIRNGSGFTTQLTLDSSGDLGLGVTPSAWSGGYLGFQVKDAAFASFTSGYTWVGNNWYNNSGNKYIANGFATLYQQNSGAHSWYTAANNSSGAGAALTFTQAMTLDASGRLGVGTTSPSVAYRMSLTGDGSTIVGGLALTSSGNTAYIGQTGGTSADCEYWNAANGYVRIGTNNTERARITSGGMLLVGTTTAYGSGGLTIEPAGASGVNLVWNKTVSGNVYATQFRYNGTIVGSIEINNTATSYVTSSDYRLKEHIAPMTGALAKVALLKPCTYKWKVDGSDGEGFIAHELAEVCPQAVTGEKDAVDKDGNPKYQGIDTSFLVATLTAAIQEQQAIITDLRARVAQLEAK